MEPYVLALPNFQGDFTVDTEALDKQIGCVLLQNQLDGADRMIRCSSCLLKDAEVACDKMQCKCVLVS